MCDCDGPTFSTTRTVTARKAHECVECRGTIALGDRYECTSGLWVDGGFLTFRTCLPCIEFRAELDCWIYGEVHQTRAELAEDSRMFP
jgi:hypothetical protein